MNIIHPPVNEYFFPKIFNNQNNFFLKLMDLHLSMKNPKFSTKLRLKSWPMKIMGTKMLVVGKISIQYIHHQNLRDELEVFWVSCKISILSIVLGDNSNYLPRQGKWRWCGGQCSLQHNSCHWCVCSLCQTCHYSQLVQSLQRLFLLSGQCHCPHPHYCQQRDHLVWGHHLSLSLCPLLCFHGIQSCYWVLGNQESSSPWLLEKLWKRGW